MTDDCYDWEDQLVPVAYAQINDRGDLYDLRLQKNPYLPNDRVITLYALKREVCRTSIKTKDKN